MALTIKRKRRRSDPSSHTDVPNAEASERIQGCYDAGDLDGVRDEAMALAGRLEQTQRHIDKLALCHELLNDKIEATMAHEHYPVVVTSVERNGRTVAEVAGLGNSRIQVAVHPDVDQEKLLVGSMGLVTRERNCLLKVTSATGRWQDVGIFERYLDEPRRILLKDRETLIAVDVAHRLIATPLKKGDLVGFDPTSGLAFERLETPKSEHLFDEDVTDDFSQLGGLNREIARIKQHLDFRFCHPDIAAKYLLKSKCGILLIGPPGNGKTRIARCCAGYIRRLYPDRPCRFMHVTGSSDYNLWFGETERKIVERFAAVREASADGLVVMFWDEVDAIARRRGTDHGSGAPDRILNTFLSQIDGIVPLSNVVLLYATNRADTLDPAFLRPGRTDSQIEIPPPNRRASEAILQQYVHRGLPLAAPDGNTNDLIDPLLSRLFAPNGDYAEVAQLKLSDGRLLKIAGRQLLSGAMLENVVNVAAQQAAAREAATGQEGLTEADLTLSLEDQLMAAVSLLTPDNVKGYVKTVPQGAQPIAVEPMLTSLETDYVRAR